MSLPHTPQRRVAFCIEALSVGGAEQMLVDLANDFVQHGWQVHLICLTEAGELAARLDDAVQLQVLSKQPGLDVKLLAPLRRTLQAINPDVVNAHLWVANLWTRLATLGTALPVVVTEHSRDSWKPRHYRWLDRLLASRTASLVAVSNDTADFYRRDIGVPERLIQVINNGVDTQRFARGDGRLLREQWASDGALLIGTVGRLVTAKNHPRLIRAFEQALASCPNLRLVIVGDGPERAAIERELESSQLTTRVHMAGARRDVPDVLAAFDVFVLSSDREGHPLTALEAQAAGTPVVLTAVGGAADAVAIKGDQAGGILVAADETALAQAIVDLANHPERRLAMGQFAKFHASAHFDRSGMTDRYRALFESVVRY